MNAKKRRPPPRTGAGPPVTPSLSAEAPSKPASTPKNVNPLFRLDDQVAIVTGAARGVGAATVRVLAAQGARIAAVDLDRKGLQAIVDEVGASVKGYVVDLSDLKAAKRMVSSVFRHFGRLDVLVNIAGICPRLPFMESRPKDWELLNRVNARSQYFLCQAVCPIMKKLGGGRIINIASTGGRTGSFDNASIYAGTKGAIVMFSKSIAREVARDNILVNCVAPGVLDTRLMWSLPKKRLEKLCETIPLRRLGRPEEVAHCIAFLASRECSYATGATFDINGGWLMV
jgi:NAD(P)-dependent dehydrogenase (short-subunit alcohol dehydrogenase family)